MTGSQTQGRTDCARCGVDHLRGSPECPGSRVGREVADKYRLVRLIGAGGMGAVYEAEHLKLGTRVAIKMLHPRFSENAEVVARFYAEARQAAGLHHPGIVQVHDFGQDRDGAPYIQMELLEGIGIGQLARSGRLSVGQAVRIGTEALDALEEAHARGLVHRDLKPDNLFLARGEGGEQRVKILDFGIAKVADTVKETGLTRSGEMLGTVLYASPEQLLSSARVDRRSDIYSMGATLFELLTGRTPVVADSVFEAVAKVTKGETERRAARFRQEVPVWLDSIVERALAPDPGARFPTAAAMATELREARFRRRGVGPALAVVVGLLALAIVGAAVFFATREPEPVVFVAAAPFATPGPVAPSTPTSVTPAPSTVDTAPKPPATSAGPATAAGGGTAIAPSTGEPSVGVLRRLDPEARTAAPAKATAAPRERTARPAERTAAPETAAPRGSVRYMGRLAFVFQGDGESEGVAQRFRARFPAFLQCYEATSDDRLGQYQIFVRWEIDEAGRATGVEVLRSGATANEGLMTCVRGVVQRTTFAPAVGGSVRIQTALGFSPRE